MSERFAILDPTKISCTDLIYLAGLIDGDGCFYISKRTLPTKAGLTQYMTKLQTQCIDEAFIDHLHATFGGVKIVNRKKPPRRFLYGIEFSGNLLTQMCELLLPHLRLKKPNCANMLEMRRTYNGKGGNIEVPKEILAIRDRCFEVSRHLNTHKPYNTSPLLS